MNDFVCLPPIKSCPLKLFTKFFTRGILKISGPQKIPGPVPKVPPGPALSTALASAQPFRLTGLHQFARLKTVQLPILFRIYDTSYHT